MRGSARARALSVVAAVLLPATVAGAVATDAFGVPGRRFASSPSHASVKRIPNALNNRSISTCPEGGQTVQVNLMRGTTTLATASTTSDARGRWAVAMSIPSNLQVGVYAVTAACFPVGGGVATLSYNPQNFRVVPPFCPGGSTTSTTARCRPRPDPGSQGTPGTPGAPGPNG